MSKEEYLELINADPEGVKDSEDGSYKFIPISITEGKLDEIFGGAWSWEFDREGFGKSYAFGKGTLTYLHPVTNQWIHRSGTAAIPLTKEMRMDFPLLESMTILSAARKIGPVFGRNLNRDREGDLISAVGLDKDPDHDAELEAAIKEMTAIPTKEEAEKYLDKSTFKYRPELKAILNSKS